MKTPPSYATRKYSVEAGGSLQVVRDAHFMTCLAANQPFKISFDSAPRTDFEAGLTFRTVDGFNRVEIINESDEILVLQVGFGRGDISDARLTLSGQVSVSEDMPDKMHIRRESVGASAVQEIAAANGLRREIIVKNEAQEPVFVLESGASAAGDGMSLEPGQALTLQTQAAITIGNTGAAIATVSLIELGR